jgi:DHA1 family bicyclomycin/chloramphenicol resistance-like MFS transporter
MDGFNLNQQQFAYAFGFNALGTMILSAMNHKLAERFNVIQRLQLGGIIQLIGAILLIIVGLFLDFGLVLTMLGLFMAVAGIGLTAPNSTALAMSQQGRQAGSASALMGGLQFIFGLSSGLILNFLFWSPVMNMAISMLIFVVFANIAIQATVRYQQQQSLTI